MPPRGRKLTAVPAQPKVGTMTAGVLATLGELELLPEDEALKVLAEEYARTMDRAAAIAAKAASLPPDPDITEELNRLRKRVSAPVTTVSPKATSGGQKVSPQPRADVAEQGGRCRPRRAGG